MAAVARPRWIPSKKMWFNGLIGIWPYVKKEPAKRNSKNRLKGTLVTKKAPSVTNEEHLKMMENNFIPEIVSKWPTAAQDRPIFIQQDNAKPHGVAGDERLQQKCLAEGWNIKFKRQPPNSPDFNVLDLGFFAAIQALQHEESPANIDELINHVDTAFHSMKREKLDNVFLSLKQAMLGALTVNGDNTYKLNHMGKDKLRRRGLLPVSIQCDQSIIESSQGYLE